MAEEQPQQPAPNPNKKFIQDLIGEKLPKSIHNFLVTEKKGLKEGWFVYLVTALVAAYFGYAHGTHSSDGNIKTLNTTVANLSSVIQSNSTSVQTLNQQLREKETENQKLIAERDKAQVETEIAKNAVAGWMAVAQSCNTNTPLTERLDILTAWVAKNTESLTNVFGESVNKSNLLSIIDSDRPSFNLIINNKIITNGSVVSIKENRKLFLSVRNTSSVTAEQLTVALLCPSCLAPTNLICGNSWAQLHKVTQTLDNGDVVPNKENYAWRWKADSLVQGGGDYDLDALEISTNMTFPVFDVRIEVYANRSKVQTYKVTLTF